jgi:hypothetical protein
MDWARILAYVTGMVDQELLARNEYLAAENRILKAQLKGRLRLADAERATLCEIGCHSACNIDRRVGADPQSSAITRWALKKTAQEPPIPSNSQPTIPAFQR